MIIFYKEKMGRKKGRQHTYDDNQTGIFAKGVGDRSSV